jgi:hypothetical protein
VSTTDLAWIILAASIAAFLSGFALAAWRHWKKRR